MRLSYNIPKTKKGGTKFRLFVICKPLIKRT